jgi:DNA-binding winged helix-turn-helix (wHTH) protein
MDARENNKIAFGPFRLERSPLRLYRGEEIVDIQPKALMVLWHLVDNLGNFVSREDLLRAIWPGIKVESNIVAVQIRAIRKALDDNYSRPKFIETLTHKGYKFVNPTANEQWRQTSRESFDVNIPLEPEVRCSRNFVELECISKLEELEYREASIDADTLKKWWRSYPKGVHLIQVGAEITGAMGIWPISKKIYNDIINGRIEETQIGKRPHDIGAPQALHRYWYIGDIIIRKEDQEKAYRPLVTLLYTSLYAWLHGENVDSLVDICAFGFTSKGQKLLERFKFVRHERKSPKGHPIYVRTAQLGELQAELENLRRLALDSK